MDKKGFERELLRMLVGLILMAVLAIIVWLIFKKKFSGGLGLE